MDLPPVCLAHPLDDGSAVLVHGTVEETAASLGPDAAAYRRLMGPLVAGWQGLLHDLLGPLRIPRHPLLMARFGLTGLLPAVTLAPGLSQRAGSCRSWPAWPHMP